MSLRLFADKVNSAKAQGLSPLGEPKDASLPIVDIRFDAPYGQVESSYGDEWAPTWGRDDVLYTGVDDGTSFGGLFNGMTFGKLEGSAPDQLTGTTISSMRTFREIPYLGPEGAAWQTLHSYRIEESLFRFEPSSVLAQGSPSWCVTRSTDGGASWAQTDGGVLSQDERGGPPHFVALSKSSAAAFDDSSGNDTPGKYVFAVTHAGLISGEDGYRISRVVRDDLLHGRGIHWVHLKADGQWKQSAGATKLFTNNTFFGPDGANWKTTNSYSVDGVLYMFVARCVYPNASGDSKRRHVFRNSSIIKSTDQGKTWTPDGKQNYNEPMFPGQRFGAPYFVWYGKDGAASADNAQDYVYAVSNNGFFENGDDYVLGRVLRSKLDSLSARDWSFYQSGNGMRDASWTQSLNEAEPILQSPGKSGMTGMTYIESLRRYVMVAWRYHRDNFEQGIKEKDLGTVLEFFEAPTPWGPWNSVKSFDTGKLGWYTPIIGQRFQAVVNSSAARVFLFSTGFFTKPEGGLDFSLYKLNHMPVTLATTALPASDPAFVGNR